MPNPIKPPSLGSTLGSTLGKSPSQPKDLGKVGKQGVSVKTPKMKKPGDAFAPPSVFFGKSEDFQGPKHPSLRNLWSFMNKEHKSKTQK
jgi:hypothetical protein